MKNMTTIYQVRWGEFYDGEVYPIGCCGHRHTSAKLAAKCLRKNYQSQHLPNLSVWEHRTGQMAEGEPRSKEVPT